MSAAFDSPDTHRLVHDVQRFYPWIYLACHVDHIRARCLTAAGAKAMAAGSVLDARRVARLIARLTPAGARRAVNGLATLARAARAMPPGRMPGRYRPRKESR